VIRIVRLAAAGGSSQCTEDFLFVVVVVVCVQWWCVKTTLVLVLRFARFFVTRRFWYDPLGLLKPNIFT
jgi:hypothetical protein